MRLIVHLLCAYVEFVSLYGNELDLIDYTTTPYHAYNK